MKEPTLIDALLRQTFKPEFRAMDAKGWLRKHLLEARRFVLDDAMSAFMADLAYSSLPKVRNAKRDQAVIDGMRTLARLPHRVTWVEFNMRARIRRAHEAYGVDLQADNSPEKGGWLFIQHPEIETAFMAVECLSHCLDTRPDQVDLGAPLKEQASPHYIVWFWRTDDGDIKEAYPDSLIGHLGSNSLGEDVPIAAALVGVLSYNSQQVAIDIGPYISGKTENNLYKSAMDQWMKQSASDLRYAWSLLAAINDTPVTVEQVRPSKGFIARGQYRKFLEHNVIRLKVPGRITLQTLAGRVMRASRRRAHQVRGHWRENYRKPGEKLWIKEHQRGDASLGFVTHDYSVERGNNEQKVHS